MSMSLCSRRLHAPIARRFVRGFIDSVVPPTSPPPSPIPHSPNKWPGKSKKKASAAEKQASELGRMLRNSGNLEQTVLKIIKDAVNNRLPRSKKRGKGGLAKATAAKQLDISANAYEKLSDTVRRVARIETGWGEDKLAPSQNTALENGTSSTDNLMQEFRKLNGSSVTSVTSEDSSSSTTPPASRAASRPSRPPHIETPLSYSRRIEGLLEPSNRLALTNVQPISEHNPIARLSHGLDRVLFNPGIHWLQDPRSRVYNFSPYLEQIPRVTDFAFERINTFTPSSKDKDLWELARREKKTFTGSTSSLTGMLGHIYFLLSGDKGISTDSLSRAFSRAPDHFSAGQRMPVSVMLNHDNGVYAIDSDKNEEAEKNILTYMGTLLEYYLTKSASDFAPFMRFNPRLPETLNPLKDAYRYAKSERFLMRSQLDCYDPRLPGTGVFDIKTRATTSIRFDQLNFEQNSGYLITSQKGTEGSFEKEYYDLIRSAFLKYSLQVRIGNMDGVIVAYHNTRRIFGFQYIPLQEMDEALFGPGEGVGDRVFAKSVALLERTLEEVIACHPGESLKCTFEKLSSNNEMNVWVQPAKWAGGEGQTPLDCPIYQLRVKVANYLGEDPVRDSIAVKSTDLPWTTHWSISRLSTSASTMRTELKEAMGRQFRFLDLPKGETVDTMQKWWQETIFDPAQVQGQAPVERFRSQALKHTLDTRELSDRGREETERRASEEEGKPKIWLGGEMPVEELERLRELVGSGREDVATSRVEVVEEEERRVETVEEEERKVETVEEEERKVETVEEEERKVETVEEEERRVETVEGGESKAEEASR